MSNNYKPQPDPLNYHMSNNYKPQPDPLNYHVNKEATTNPNQSKLTIGKHPSNMQFKKGTLYLKVHTQ